VSGQLAQALLAELDDQALDRLAELLAPYLRARVGAPDAVQLEPLISCTEAAERAAVCVETVRRAVRSGALLSSTAGRAVRIAPADLKLWLTDRGRQYRKSTQPRARAGRAGRPLADALAGAEKSNGRSA
jgi:excisionase family DNA binding protein